MSKIDELRSTYIKDADLMASKSRFGYFSIPPNTTAGISSFQERKPLKDENGKVKTQQRNIFSGLTASGVLKKSFFNYQTSVFQGDPYIDPGKNQRRQKMQENKKLLGKDVYKPLDLVKTPPPKSSYQHIPQKPKTKQVKDFIDQNGKVKTEQRNIMANSNSTIEKIRLKQFKYVHDPYQNHLVVQKNQNKRSITLRGQAPFKNSSNSKGLFSTARQTYGLEQKYKREKSDKKSGLNVTVDHQANFRPSCSKKYDTFSYPEYMAGGQKPIAKVARNNSDKSKQTFKLVAPYKNSKPSPSITTFKSNILKFIR